MMKIVPVIIIFFLLTGCMSSNKWFDGDSPTTSKNTDSLAVQILEDNKEDLTYIKDRTADDIELGYEVRKLSNEVKDDQEFATQVRELINAQTPMREEPKIEEWIPSVYRVTDGIIVIVFLVLILNVFNNQRKLNKRYDDEAKSK